MSNFFSPSLRARQSFRYQSLVGADFCQKNIRGLDFEGADLSGANFTGAQAGVSAAQASLLQLYSIAGIIFLSLTAAGVGGFITCFPIVWGLTPTSSFLVNFLPAEFGSFISDILLIHQFNQYTPSLVFVAVVICFVRTLCIHGLAGTRSFLIISMVFAFTITVCIGVLSFLYSLVYSFSELLNFNNISDAMSTGAIGEQSTNFLTFFIAAIVGLIPAVIGVLVLMLCALWIGVCASTLEIVRTPNTGNTAVYATLAAAAFGGAVGAFTVVERTADVPPKIVTIAVATSLLFSGLATGLTIYISRQAVERNSKFDWIRQQAKLIASAKGTRFDGSQLTEATFECARISGVSFAGAMLTRTDWKGAHRLDDCLVDAGYLANPAIRELLTTKKGRQGQFAYLDLGGVNLSSADLSGCNFEGTDLANTDLREANLQGAKLMRSCLNNANLTKADITGACIENWSLTESTCIDKIVCKYVYVQVDTVPETASENVDAMRLNRLPRKRNFRAGEGERFLRSLIHAVVLEDNASVSLEAVIAAIKRVSREHNTVLKVLSIEQYQARLFIKVLPIDALVSQGTAQSLAGKSILKAAYRKHSKALSLAPDLVQFNGNVLDGLKHLTKRLRLCNIFLYSDSLIICGDTINLTIED